MIVITVTSPTNNVPIQIGGTGVVTGPQGNNSLKKHTTIALNGQTVFTLPTDILGEAFFFRNGNALNANCYTWANNVVTYIPSSNNNEAMEAGDEIQVLYTQLLQGATFWTGSGVPSNEIGVNGCVYLNKLNGDIYERIAGLYVVQTNIIGPQGPAVLSLAKHQATATALQTEFILPTTPAGAVLMFRNGFLLNDASYSKDISTISYIPANNDNIDIEAGDEISFLYSQTYGDLFANYYTKSEDEAQTILKSNTARDAAKAYADSLLNNTIPTQNKLTNAADFGFLPSTPGSASPIPITNGASANTIAFQNAINQGGTILISKVGVYDVNDVLQIGSDTQLIFAEGVYIRKGKKMVAGVLENYRYIFINSGAYTRTYNENISIIGLNVIINGIDEGNFGDWQRSGYIHGLIGNISFFYVKNLHLNRIRCTDAPDATFFIQACTFDNVLIENTFVRGKLSTFNAKDNIHIGTGNNITIRNHNGTSYDDNVAFTGYDYDSCSPESGDITNIIVDGVVDDNYRATRGACTLRLLGGGWVDWSNGMTVQFGDAVVSAGRIYRATEANPTSYGSAKISTTQPTHSSGLVTLDGIKWWMQQVGTFKKANISGVTFKNIKSNANRSSIVGGMFEDLDWLRSWRTGADVFKVENVKLYNITKKFAGTYQNYLVAAGSALTTLTIKDTDFYDDAVVFDGGSANMIAIGSQPTPNVLFLGNNFNTPITYGLVRCSYTGKVINVKIVGSNDNGFSGTLGNGMGVATVNVIVSDIS